MTNKFCDAHTETPTPGLAWRQRSDDERIAAVSNTLATMAPPFRVALTVSEARQDGQVIVRLHDSPPADQRGTLLLDLEEFLKDSIDSGLTLWLVPIGDRSSLRNLRGIEVAA